MPKVLISDKMSSLAAELLRARGLEVDEAPGLAPDALAGRLGDCDGLIVRSATKVTADLIKPTRQKISVPKGLRKKPKNLDFES